MRHATIAIRRIGWSPVARCPRLSDDVDVHSASASWGVDYSKNLRTIVQREDADKWVHTLKTADDGDGHLPMPWHNTALMPEEDLRAMWKYIYSLDRLRASDLRGVSGERTNRTVHRPESHNRRHGQEAMGNCAR